MGARPPSAAAALRIASRTSAVAVLRHQRRDREGFLVVVIRSSWSGGTFDRAVRALVQSTAAAITAHSTSMSATIDWAHGGADFRAAFDSHRGRFRPYESGT